MSKNIPVDPRLPRGLADRSSAEIALTHQMMEVIRRVYHSYGFEALETPFLEYTEVLGKFLPDQDRPNAGVFSLQDDDGQWISLRYDLTAPLARHVAEQFETLPRPYRSYRAGWVFRNEKPGPGRFRQFMQFDADIVGSSTPAADAEMCMMMADTLEALGIARGDYVIRVSSRQLLDKVMDETGVVDPAQRLAVLRAIDKLDRLGMEGVQALLGAGRLDDSGDFTKGAGLARGQIDTLLAFLQSGSGMAAERAPELAEVASLVDQAGYTGRVQLDPSVVRGLEYYTGVVFEAELTFAGRDGARFGSVGGGGRYDGLVGRFRQEDVPATGFSIGVSRLMAALQHLGSAALPSSAAPVVIVPRVPALIGMCQGVGRQLRASGLDCDVYLGSGSFKGGLKYADRRGCACAVMIGESEAEAGTAVVKDLVEGARQAQAIASNAEYRSQRLAQTTVALTSLADALKDIQNRAFPLKE